MVVGLMGSGSTSNPAGFPKTVNLTPTSNGCTSSLASTTCELTLTLQAGTYVATITTYDATGGTGNVLSAAQAVPFTVLAAQSNTIALTLGGYPSTITATPLAPGYLQSSASGLKLYGPESQSLLVEAQDVDGNTIVGAGAPTIGATSTAASQLAVTAPSTASPNIVKLQAPTLGSPPAVAPGIVGITLTATPSADSGGTTVTANVDVQILHSALYVALCAVSGCSTGSNAVVGYLDGSTSGQLVNIDFTGSVLSGLAADDNGTLYVTTNGSAVTPYQVPVPSAGTAIAMGLNDAGALAVDGSGQLFVSNSGGSPDVALYPTGFTSPSSTLSIGSSALAVDDADTLYTILGVNIHEYPAGSATANISFSGTTGSGGLNLGSPLGIAVDGKDAVYIIYTSGLAEVAAHSSTNVALVENGISSGSAVAVDAAGNIFVANSGSTANVVEYAPGFTSSSEPSATFSTGAGAITGIAVVPRPL